MSNDNNDNTDGRFAGFEFDEPVSFAGLFERIVREAERIGEEKQDIGVYLIHAAMVACDIVKAGGEINWDVPNVSLNQKIEKDLDHTPESA